MTTPRWTYDRVTNAEGKIVALCYHQRYTGECLARDTIQLKNEGLNIRCVRLFPTLQEAKAHAWLEKDKFVEGLD